MNIFKEKEKLKKKSIHSMMLSKKLQVKEFQELIKKKPRKFKINLNNNLKAKKLFKIRIKMMIQKKKNNNRKVKENNNNRFL